MTEEQKKALFFQLVTKKMSGYRNKEIFYKALGGHCGRGMRTAQRWVDGEKWPTADKQLRQMWDFVDMQLLDNGDIVKKDSAPSTVLPLSLSASTDAILATLAHVQHLLDELRRQVEQGHEVIPINKREEPPQ